MKNKSSLTNLPAPSLSLTNHAPWKKSSNEWKIHHLPFPAQSLCYEEFTHEERFIRKVFRFLERNLSQTTKDSIPELRRHFSTSRTTGRRGSYTAPLPARVAIEHTLNSLQWWQPHHHRFPVLRYMVFGLLAAPAGNPADERVFSKTRSVLNEDYWNT